MGIRTAFSPMNRGQASPYHDNDILFEGRPEPANGGQNNINASLVLYKGDVCEVIVVGGGSNSAYGGYSGYDGGSGAAFKGTIKILKTIEVPLQVGAKTNKNTYPKHKDSFIGDFIIAQGAGGATDNNWGNFFYGSVIINDVDWAEVVSTAVRVGTQRSNSYKPISGTTYGQCFYTGYLKITKIKV